MFLPKAKYIVIIEYDGTQYYGFQWQLSLPTIQGELEKAIGRFCEQSSRVMAAGRTDAGVHAKGQVVSFCTKSTLDTITLVKALNYYLPKDIAAKTAYTASSDFNVRRDAVSREYRYLMLSNTTRSPLSQRFALHMPKMLDIEAMNKACSIIQGEHDFISFASSLDDERNTVRNIYEAQVDKRGSFIVLRVVANSFLRHQIRNTVGLLIRLGLGKISIGDFHDILEARKLGLAGPSSPAHGLCLIKVNYNKPLGVST